MKLDCDANSTYSPDKVTREEVGNLLLSMGNPSAMHRGGQRAKALVEQARTVIRRACGASERDTLIFTSGATEANAHAIFGLLSGDDGVLSSRAEHPCVLSALSQWEESHPGSVQWVRLAAGGEIDLASIERLVTSSTRLVTLMAANNETGILTDIAEVIRRVKHISPLTLVHTDASQLIGKGTVSFREWGCDLMTISAHKVGGLPGCGALLVREGIPLRPFLGGGSQEGKLRGGTENVLGIAVFGSVLGRVLKELPNRIALMTKARDRFEQAVCAQLPDVIVHGNALPRLPNTSNVFVPGVRADDLVVALDLAGYLTSTGAACTSGKREPSHVLLAMGFSAARASESIRISFRADATESDVDGLVAEFVRCVTRMKETVGRTSSLAHGAREHDELRREA